MNAAVWALTGAGMCVLLTAWGLLPVWLARQARKAGRR